MTSQKIWELNRWFEDYFEKQLIQSMWQQNYKPSFDYYFEKNYKDINELKAQAENVRQQLISLRSEV